MPDLLGDLSYTWPYGLAILLGYLLGSIPFGLVVTKLAGLGDVRQIGSGNIGATNVLRTGRKGLALATLILDGGKGAAAALIGLRFGPDIAVLAGGAAFVGHLFPVWLRFKGGKGVATALGILLAIAWPIGILACLLWLLVAAVFRFSSLASLLSMASAPILAWQAMGDLQLVEFSAIIALLVWLRHFGNISRLLRGEEPKIGKTKDAT